MTKQKKIVLDANILIRAVLGKKVRTLLANFSDSIGFFTPDVCFDDAYKYIPKIFSQRNLPLEDVDNTLKLIACYVQVVDKKQYKIYQQEAQKRIEIRDLEDWPILATALFFNCPIWTEDTDFFGSGMATWTTDRVHLYLSSN